MSSYENICNTLLSNLLRPRLSGLGSDQPSLASLPPASRRSLSCTVVPADETRRDLTSDLNPSSVSHQYLRLPSMRDTPATESAKLKYWITSTSCLLERHRKRPQLKSKLYHVPSITGFAKLMPVQYSTASGVGFGKRRDPSPDPQIKGRPNCWPFVTSLDQLVGEKRACRYSGLAHLMVSQVAEDLWSYTYIYGNRFLKPLL
ncbi:hypothetical protein F4860DRAFT_330938 [Xylaria cubensis]|nr:hypothetical protein F4860DRAFT_330938 [Xylaria cubensis]